MTPDPEWVAANAEAMAAIAPVLDEMEREINSQGPVDMITAYIVALRAIQLFHMDSEMLEKFVAVLLADRTYQAVTP